MTTNAPWIFIVREELLPGRFSIQPIDPPVLSLIDQDPEHSILTRVYVASLEASATYEVYKNSGLIRHHSIQSYANCCEVALHKALNETVWVIPEEEFDKRVARGEFTHVRLLTKEDRLKMGEVFHQVMSVVLANYYQGASKDRQDNMLLRLRPFDVDALKNLGDYSVTCDQEYGLRWRHISLPEVQKFSHLTYRMPHKDCYWRVIPRGTPRREKRA